MPIVRSYRSVPGALSLYTRIAVFFVGFFTAFFTQCLLFYVLLPIGIIIIIIIIIHAISVALTGLSLGLWQTLTVC